ncbi:unknown [Ruminococcus sp. CAG:379]|nr:unknown [Ruminococcus sp. CAG:379]
MGAVPDGCLFLVGQTDERVRRQTFRIPMDGFQGFCKGIPDAVGQGFFKQIRCTVHGQHDAFFVSHGNGIDPHLAGMGLGVGFFQVDLPAAGHIDQAGEYDGGCHTGTLCFLQRPDIVRTEKGVVLHDLCDLLLVPGSAFHKAAVRHCVKPEQKEVGAFSDQFADFRVDLGAHRHRYVDQTPVILTVFED